MANPFAELDPRPAILQVVPALETGGAERTTVDMARAIVAAGGRAIVASRGGRMVEELIEAGASHVEMAVHSKNPVVMGLNVERLARLIERESVDLVHARSRAPGWSALAAARRTKIPFVTTYHSRVHERPRLKVFYNSVMVRGDAVIANSQWTAGNIRAVHKPEEARIFTVPRGIDIAAFAAPAADRIAALKSRWGIGDDAGTVFLHPARLTRWKGQGVSIEAARLLKERGVTDFTLLLAGDAQGRESYVEELRQAISAAGLDDRVRLVGHCDDMAAAYALSDCVLSPSIEPEPFGRTAVEAQAASRPVIVSDAGGQQETVLEGKTGFRVPPGDAAALAGAMTRVEGMDTAARAAMGTAGHDNAATHYSVAAMCGATLSIYARLVAQSRAPAGKP
ncbi:MAG: glycosyltransferase family 4 protein [Alphaproteobacteria bacterium]|nr:glycosyltransferase family 4 protein [Alphaproteobacteria bacterium]MDX5416637.1 glycosyltransferase family 4 protein [Alphaproteobacteria bacterium]MDX5494009.1 glycosyltransferase family 4 protein [Alphaproteobacteria bacterium]